MKCHLPAEHTHPSYECYDVIHLVSWVYEVSLLAQLSREGEDAHGVDVEGDEGPHHQGGPHQASHPGHHTRLVKPQAGVNILDEYSFILEFKGLTLSTRKSSYSLLKILTPSLQL